MYVFPAEAAFLFALVLAASLSARRGIHTPWRCFGGAIAPAGTVVEMLTGRLPYADMGPEQAYYLIGLKCAPV